MVTDQIVLPYLWRRYLSLLRALVGASCLWVVLGSQGIKSTTWLALAGTLTVYSLVSVFWRLPEQLDRLGILNLVLDVSAFFLCVALGQETDAWLPSIAALYLFLATATQQDWRDVLLITVLSLAFVNSVRPPNYDRLQPLLLVLGMFGCVVALQKQSLMERLSNVSRQAVLYRRESQQAREAERERIAADFHDGPLQAFIAVQMRIEIARKMLERNHEAGMEELRQLRDVCSQQVTEVRSFVRSMRPIELDAAGLGAALRSTVGFFQKDSGISATFKADPGAMHDDIETSTEVVQIVREALNNVRKHSSAAHVSVSLTRGQDHLEIGVEDDGMGFPFAGEFSLEELELLRLGPLSIMKRARSLDGDLTVASRPGRGTELRLRLPL
jgi:signal transduction histidine kinase